MQKSGIYQEIAERTGGDIYIGVVGPVRTGKSTFIKRFMETMVIPGIENVYKKERAKDELPQSGSGRTIMTAEPKFVPEEAAELNLPGGGACKIRLVDCVGYLIEGAMGHQEDDKPRMVSTPWNSEPIPMEEAAETGTAKVIREHSTIGLVITTDGSVTEFDRAAYIPAEERVISELKKIQKPFLVVLNTKDPQSQQAQETAAQIREKYQVSVMALNCQNLGENEVREVLTSVLYEFPVKEIEISLPGWISSLSPEHPVKKEIYNGILQAAGHVAKMRDVLPGMQQGESISCVSEVQQRKMHLGEGRAELVFAIPPQIFYQIAGEETGLAIRDEADLIPLLRELSQVRQQYQRFAGALEQVKQTGYGIVMPTIEEMVLAEPEVIKQGGRYGVKLSATAPSVHLIRANIETAVTPIVGSEKQSEELIAYLLSDFNEDPHKIWDSNIFGKSLQELVGEGLHNKLGHMPEDARAKLQETLEKIINEGSGGLICILL